MWWVFGLTALFFLNTTAETRHVIHIGLSIMVWGFGCVLGLMFWLGSMGVDPELMRRAFQWLFMFHR